MFCDAKSITALKSWNLEVLEQREDLETTGSNLISQKINLRSNTIE